MKLEDIGFYTLSDARAREASATSPFWRCELIVTDRCNLKCPYCRGVRREIRGDMPLAVARRVLELWIADGLRNVRFSGGEPTLYTLAPLIDQCREGGVKRIAISTNGTASLDVYYDLMRRGVNDFSISLDGGCCAVSERMNGGTDCWSGVVANIRALSCLTYVTVGMVFTDDNIADCIEAVRFASSLGPADIRVIPAAQYATALGKLAELPDDLLAKHPILRYRVENAREQRPVRGIKVADCHKCWLALDDMAVAGKWHFPCIIHLREGGAPVGEIGPGMREERAAWVQEHDSYADPICRRNCLDVCVDYNNKCDRRRLRASAGVRGKVLPRPRGGPWAEDWRLRREY